MNNSPITISGNVVRDPELLTLGNGTQKLSFAVAVNHSYTGKDGEKVENTSFFDVQAWRYLAENSANVLEKGMGVIVNGRLEQRSWKDEKTQENRYKIELVADEIGILTRSVESVERRRAAAGTPNAGAFTAPKRTKPSAPQVPADEPF
jgi:single-strand DNA-binding protein